MFNGVVGENVFIKEHRVCCSDFLKYVLNDVSSCNDECSIIDLES